jgi:hypothetical protein
LRSGTRTGLAGQNKTYFENIHSGAIFAFLGEKLPESNERPCEKNFQYRSIPALKKSGTTVFFNKYVYYK